MPFPCWRRAVRKNVSEVTAAACAHFLHPNHPVAGVAQALDVRLVIRAEETRPAGAGIELRVRAEERQSAEAACIDAVLLVIKKDTAKRSLGAVLEQHAALTGVQSGDDLAPLRLGRWGQVKGAHGRLPAE